MAVQYGPGRVTFYPPYDAVFWWPIENTAQGPLIFNKWMRCCYGSKVTIDTWISKPVSTQPKEPSDDRAE